MPNLRSVFAGALLAVCLFATAQAATLQVSPVKVDFNPGQNAVGVTLRNPGDSPVYGQVRVFQWTQADNQDVLVPTQAMVASPPLIQIPGHAEQLVRLVRVAHDNAATEQSYRILIDEIPQPSAASHSGVTIRMRYSIPVFVAPPASTANVALTWKVLRREGQWYLQVVNQGGMHAQLGALTLTTAAGQSLVISQGLLGYALAGQTREFRLAVGSGVDLSGALTVQVNLNAQALTVRLAGEG